ncbi:MAG: Hsp20/alpha crystallin family protein [Candidatus Micrarchaeaceae archaeon]
MPKSKKERSTNIEPIRAGEIFDVFNDPFDYMRRMMSYPRKYIGTFMSRAPRIDMIDRSTELVIKADLPGVDKNDIKVNVSKESITISAQASKEREETGRNYYYSERAASGYYRRIPLPVAVEPKRVKATFKDGMLEVVLPKAPGEGEEVKIE